MRTAILATVFVAMIGGCADQHKSQEAQTNESGGSASSLTDALKQSDWSAEKTNSGIDGETYTATRVYQFPDHQTHFQVTASCVAHTGVSELTIDSFIGDPQKPSEGSAFLAAGSAPEGRAKGSDNAVAEIATYFIVGDYNNRLKFNFGNPVSEKAISEAPGYSQFASNVGEGDLNYAKLLLAALPLTVQVKNGAGSFELALDKSKELVDTLNACGAGGPLLTDGYSVRAKEAEQTARAEVMKGIRNICGYRGVVRETSEQWISNAKSLSIPLDCAASAPDELAAFNSKIDAYLKVAQDKGIACSRDALLQEAQEAGIDNSFVFDRFLQSGCSS